MKLIQTEIEIEPVTYVGETPEFIPNIDYSSLSVTGVVIMGPPIKTKAYAFITKSGEPFSFPGPPKFSLELKEDEHLELERKYLCILGMRKCISKKLVKLRTLR